MISLRRAHHRYMTALRFGGSRCVHIGSTDPGRQSFTAPRFPDVRREPPLTGDAAYREALRIRYEAQREALELRIRQETQVVEESNEKKVDKKLSLLSKLANVHHDFGDYAQERKHLEELVAACIEAKGPDHPMTAAATARLSACLGYMGDYEAQLALVEGLRDRLQKIYPNPSDSTQVAVILHHLATAYENNDKINEQIVTLTHIVELLDASVGPTAEPTAVTVNKLAAAYGILGLYDNQVKLLENRIPLFIAALGATHAHVCVAWLHLALAYGHVGRRQEQLGLYEALESAAAESFGSDLHPFVLTVKRNRAVARAAVDQAARPECIAVLVQVGKDMDAVIGPADPECQATLHALAHLLGQSGKVEESLKHYDELLRRMISAGLNETSESIQAVKRERRRIANSNIAPPPSSSSSSVKG